MEWLAVICFTGNGMHTEYAAAVVGCVGPGSNVLGVEDPGATLAPWLSSCSLLSAVICRRTEHGPSPALPSAPPTCLPNPIWHQ